MSKSASDYMREASDAIEAAVIKLVDVRRADIYERVADLEKRVRDEPVAEQIDQIWRSINNALDGAHRAIGRDQQLSDRISKLEAIEAERNTPEAGAHQPAPRGENAYYDAGYKVGVQAERERCAKIAENSDVVITAMAKKDWIAANIRSGK